MPEYNSTTELRTKAMRSSNILKAISRAGLFGGFLFLLIAIANLLPLALYGISPAWAEVFMPISAWAEVFMPISTFGGY